MQQRYIRIKDLTERYGIPRSTVYYWQKSLGFPQPIKLGKRRVVWSVDEIERWIEERRKGNERE
ncbi:MAG: AlpA family phage regulatory protein [Deltaproteobacteria bacterium]|nr:AlpA family phage regulatory protein [Deltaproteobacteria bacterium]MBW2068942.1 AlpA family phage regulatory protein [Deltaproteobacteria bacterium]